MARGEVTGRKNATQPVTPMPIALTSFARVIASARSFLQVEAAGLMPATFNVGTRVLISREAAAAWRRERENAAQ